MNIRGYVATLLNALPSGVRQPVQQAFDAVLGEQSGVTAGTYGSSLAIPVLTIDGRGRVTAASASTFSAGSGSGDVVGPSTSVSGEVALFSGTTGKALTRATGTGVVRVSSGVYGTPGNVVESEITLTDNTTNNVDTTKHGFTPKAPNSTSQFLRGDGAWGTPNSNAAAVTPSDVSGLLLWLKADAGVYKNAGSSLALDTETVQQWNDQSTNANHVSQATSGKRPTYRTNIKNGLPVVRFSGGQCLTKTSFAVTTLTALTVFQNTGASAMVYEQGTDSGSTNGFCLSTSQPTPPSVQVQKGGVKSSRLNTAAWGQQGGFILAGQQYGGSHATHYAIVNGIANPALTGTGNDPGSSNVSATLNIGARNDALSNAMTGDLCELLIYSPAISMQDMRALVQYLQQRWDV